MIFFNPRKDLVHIVLFNGPLISWHYFGRLLVGKLQNNNKARSEKMWLTLTIIVRWSYHMSILVGVLFCLRCIVLSDQTLLVVGLFLQYIFLHKCRHKHDIAFGIKFQTGRIACYFCWYFTVLTATVVCCFHSTFTDDTCQSTLMQSHVSVLCGILLRA